MQFSFLNQQLITKKTSSHHWDEVFRGTTRFQDIWLIKYPLNHCLTVMNRPDLNIQPGTRDRSSKTILNISLTPLANSLNHSCSTNVLRRFCY